MSDTPHPLVIDGHRYWFVNGRLRPFIAGGATEDAPPAADDPSTPPADDMPADAPADQPPADLSAEVEKWKAMARKHEGNAKANAEAARKLAEIEDAAKSEAERLAEQATKAEQRATQAETALARLRVASSKGLPPELADRLVGSTEEELAEDADRLLTLVKPSDGTPPKPTGSADTGPQGAPPSNTPTLQQQIADAQKAGDHKRVIALNSQLLAQVAVGDS
jgi:hypothetical protein